MTGDWFGLFKAIGRCHTVFMSADQAPSSAEGPNRRNSHRTIINVTLAVGLALAAGVAGGAIVYATVDNGSSSIGDSVSSGRCAGVKVADTVLPSVVTISVRTANSASNGSGSIVRDDGYVLTNDHVISPAATSGTISVVFSSGQSEPAKLVGRVTSLDLAVLKVDASEKLPTIKTGDSENLLVGQPVVALGAPLGLSSTVTSGIVSALGRDVPVPADNGTTAMLPGAVQTDASINPGNSGGPLVDCAGKQIGVNTAIATVPNSSGQSGGGSVGIGFAIPMDLATVVADQLIDTGQFRPATLGAATVPIPEAVAERFGVSDGLFVQSVTPGGPAEQAGLQAGDVITHLNGQATTGPDSILIALLTKKSGDKVTIEYVREGKSATTTATLTEG
jgi:putative serine protease PepD